MCIDIYVERRWIPGTLGNPPRIYRFLKNATYRRPILRFDKLLEGAPRKCRGCTDGPRSSGGAGGQGHPDGVSCGFWFYSTLFVPRHHLSSQSKCGVDKFNLRSCLLGIMKHMFHIDVTNLLIRAPWVSVGDIEVSSLNFRVTIFQRRYRFFSSTLREIMSNYVQRRSNM